MSAQVQIRKRIIYKWGRRTLKTPRYEMEVIISSNLYTYFKVVYSRHYETFIHQEKILLMDISQHDSINDDYSGDFTKKEDCIEIGIARGITHSRGVRFTYLKERHMQIIQNVFEDLLKDYQEGYCEEPWSEWKSIE